MSAATVAGCIGGNGNGDDDGELADPEDYSYDREEPDDEEAAPGGDVDQERRAERMAEATELLLDAFARESICARDRPHYEIESEYGDGRHLAACHLHR